MRKSEHYARLEKPGTTTSGLCQWQFPPNTFMNVTVFLGHCVRRQVLITAGFANCLISVVHAL